MLELLERGVPPNNSDYYTREKKGLTPLHIACYYNHHYSAELLIKYGAIAAATTKYNRTSLHSACITNSKKCAELILEYGCPKGEPGCQSNYMAVGQPCQ